MQEFRLSKGHARRFMLSHHGLSPPYSLQGKDGVLDYIRRVGCIQFDPLNIVGRNPELVLQARVMDFRPVMLEELLYEERELLDGWDKNMSIYPVEDWPYFQRRREGARRYYGDASRPANAILTQVREAIEERGPLSSIDLDFDQTVDWSWAPTRIARAALESMHAWGEVVIHHRVNTRKVYDFASRHFPADLLSAPDPNKTEEQYHNWYVHRRIGGMGLVWNRSGDAWLGMAGIKSAQRQAALNRLFKDGKLVKVHVEGIDLPLYIRSQDRNRLEEILDHVESSPQAAILAPLDNLLWDRRLVKELFGFYYVWEVYKPVAERQFGYYVLPILYGDRFVGRFEPGRDKEKGTLIIKNWWWEAGVNPSEGMRSGIRKCFKDFMQYLSMDKLQVDSQVVERADLDWLVSIQEV